MQEFPIIAKRLKHPNRTYRIDTIFRIVDDNYVLIASEMGNNRLMNHYNQFNLIMAAREKYSKFSGITARKNLDNRLRAKINKL